MKRFLCLFLSTIMFLTLFSCSTKIDEEKIKSDTQKSTSDALAFDGNTVQNAAPPNNTYHYDSYIEIAEALTGADTKENQKLISNSDRWGDIYEKTLMSFKTGKSKLYIPTANGTTIGLREEEGYSRITFLSSELYNLPWICYHCNVDGYDLRISIAYTSVLNNAAVDNAKSYVELLNVIAPEAPNPSNYKEDSRYLYVYEEDLMLGDGESVTAMISTLKDDTRGYVAYYKDGIIVILHAKMRVLTYKFLNSFDMVEYVK